MDVDSAVAGFWQRLEGVVTRLEHEGSDHRRRAEIRPFS